MKELEKNYNIVKQEAKISFNDDEIYMEKFIKNPRHVEIQILADEHVRQLVRIRLFEEIYSSFARGYIKEYLAYSSMCLYTFLSTFIFQEQFNQLKIIGIALGMGSVLCTSILISPSTPITLPEKTPPGCRMSKSVT